MSDEILTLRAGMSMAIFFLEKGNVIFQKAEHQRILGLEKTEK